MKKVLSKLALVVIGIIMFLILIILSSSLVEKVLLPDDYLFYEHTPVFSLLLAPLMAAPAILIADYIVYYIRKLFTPSDYDFLDISGCWKALGKWRFIITAVWVIAMYASFTSLNYVTSDSIVKVTPLNPTGDIYSYSEVEKIQTGFGDKVFSLVEHNSKGSFFYKLILDGKETVFHVPSPNPTIERYEDSYLELEELDQALTRLNIPKEASRKGYEDCDYDQVYIDRFLRIIDSE